MAIKTYEQIGIPFLFGIIIYYLVEKVEISDKVCVLGEVGSFILFLSVGALFKNAYNAAVYLSIAFLFALIYFKGKNKSVKRNEIANFLARSTFCLYLVHYSICDLICNMSISITNTEKFVIAIAISWIVSTLLYFLIDNIEKYFKSRRVA